MQFDSSEISNGNERQLQTQMSSCRVWRAMSSWESWQPSFHESKTIERLSGRNIGLRCMHKINFNARLGCKATKIGLKVGGDWNAIGGAISGHS